MEKTLLSDEQIITILKLADAGQKVSDCRNVAPIDCADWIAPVPAISHATGHKRNCANACGCLPHSTHDLATDV